ncbi:hypothetical protein NP92_07260 [Anoxybacillus gonensis]|nr:hypothetical protein AFK25_13395 [Anoxybacillus gonensis]KGP60579.1 hypothetical protein NP92_07260 [Anoxybacillus gonensis]
MSKKTYLLLVIVFFIQMIVHGIPLFSNKEGFSDKKIVLLIVSFLAFSISFFMYMKKKTN